MKELTKTRKIELAPSCAKLFKGDHHHYHQINRTVCLPFYHLHASYALPFLPSIIGGSYPHSRGSTNLEGGKTLYQPPMFPDIFVSVHAQKKYSV